MSNTFRTDLECSATWVEGRRARSLQQYLDNFQGTLWFMENSHGVILISSHKQHCDVASQELTHFCVRESKDPRRLSNLYTYWKSELEFFWFPDFPKYNFADNHREGILLVS